MQLPSTVDRVPGQTAEDVNESIRKAAERRVIEAASRPALIGVRLAELDREWDVERALEANAAAAAMLGVALGATVDRRWFALPGVVGAFLLQHALQGWCPPLPVLRRCGFRTAREIETERIALKALRGDFGDLAGDTPKDRAMRALAAAGA